MMFFRKHAPDALEDASSGMRSQAKGSIRLRSFLILLFVPIIILMMISVSLLVHVNSSISKHTSNLSKETVQKILYAQRSFVNLESLRSALSTLATTPGLANARSAYIDAFALLSESSIDRHESMKAETMQLLSKIRTVWLERQKLETERDVIYREWKIFHGFGLMTYLLSGNTGNEAGGFPAVMRGNERIDIVEAKVDLLSSLAHKIYADSHQSCTHPVLSENLKNACDGFTRSYERLNRQFSTLKASNQKFQARLDDMEESTSKLSRLFIEIESQDILKDVGVINQLADQLQPIVGTFTVVILLICAVLILGFMMLLRPLRAISIAIERFEQTLRVPDRIIHSPILELSQISEWLTVLFKRFAKEQSRSKELFSSYRSLLWTSSHDALTGLANRYALQNFINTTPVAPARLGLMMVDIDFFKRINDTRGHLFGDKVLQAAAHTLKAAVSESDEVFRYGGEEFCVICPDVSDENLRKIAARLLKAVRHISRDTAELHEDEAENPLTISIGCARVNLMPGAQSIESMIAAADEALYRAKQRGRNRAETAPLSTADAPQP